MLNKLDITELRDTSVQVLRDAYKQTVIGYKTAEGISKHDSPVLRAVELTRTLGSSALEGELSKPFVLGTIIYDLTHFSR